MAEDILGLSRTRRHESLSKKESLDEEKRVKIRESFLQKSRLEVFFDSPQSPEEIKANPKPPINEEIDSVVEQQISATTQARVIVTKHFLAEYWYGLFDYLEQRQKRLEELNQSLETGNRSFMEKAKAQINFFTKESEQLRWRRTKPSFTHFMTLARIGRGGYGNVNQKKIDLIFET